MNTESVSLCLLFVQPQLPYFFLTRNTESVSCVFLHSPTHPTAPPTRFLFVRLPTRLSISCAFFPPQIPTNKRRRRERGSRDGQTDRQEERQISPTPPSVRRRLLQFHVPHIALCSRIASDRRLLFLWKLLGAQKRTASRRRRQFTASETQSQSPLLLTKFRSLLLLLEFSLPSFLSVGDISVPHHNFSPLRNPRG